MQLVQVRQTRPGRDSPGLGLSVRGTVLWVQLLMRLQPKSEMLVVCAGKMPRAKSRKTTAVVQTSLHVNPHTTSLFKRR